MRKRVLDFRLAESFQGPVQMLSIHTQLGTQDDSDRIANLLL